MALYSYVIVNPDGKEKKGTLDAETRDQAAAQLKKDGGTLVSLTEAGALSQDVNISFLDKKPSARDLSVFCRQFVSIISAGVAVTNALEMLGEQTENKMLAKAIQGCRLSIQAGTSLSEAMRDYPKVFDNLFITMVEAGEASGSLEVSFSRMADQFEKEAKLKGLVKKASIYPIVICVVAAAVVVLMLTFVVPTFEDMLNDLGVELPAITKFVLAASAFLQVYWWLVVIIIVALVFWFRYFRKTDAGQLTLGRIELKLPVFKNLVIKSASARMARTLSTLLAAGIPMIQALAITSGTMTNVFFRRAIEQSREDVAIGEGLSASLKRSGVFPPLVHHMIGIGEETGDIDGMLTTLADYYDEEVELATQQVMALLEPMIIIVLAVIVGTIVFAVIAPMGAMYAGLDNL